MDVLRQLLIGALLPLVVWSGVPQTACLCSNGEIHFSCPKLSQQKSANAKSCCGQDCCQADSNLDGHASCCQSEPGQSEEPSVRAVGCRCSLLMLAGESATVEVAVAEILDCTLWVPVIAPQHPAPVTVGPEHVVDRDPHPAAGVHVLCQRWLI